jgi:ketopantoate reductase
VPELLQAGHQVVGLARSDKSAEALKTAGVEVEKGTPLMLHSSPQPQLTKRSFLIDDRD